MVSIPLKPEAKINSSLSYSGSVTVFSHSNRKATHKTPGGNLTTVSAHSPSSVQATLFPQLFHPHSCILTSEIELATTNPNIAHNWTSYRNSSVFTPCRGAPRRNSGITAGKRRQNVLDDNRKKEWFPVMARQLHHTQCLEGTPRTYASSSWQNLSMERRVEPEI